MFLGDNRIPMEKHTVSDSTDSDTSSHGSLEYLSSSSGSVWGVPKKNAKGLDARTLAIANCTMNVKFTPSFPESPFRVGAFQGQARDVGCPRRGDKWSKMWKSGRDNAPSEKGWQTRLVEEDVGHRSKYDEKRPLRAGNNATTIIKELKNQMGKSTTFLTEFIFLSTGIKLRFVENKYTWVRREA